MEARLSWGLTAAGLLALVVSGCQSNTTGGAGGSDAGGSTGSGGVSAGGGTGGLSSAGGAGGGLSTTGGADGSGDALSTADASGTGVKSGSGGSSGTSGSGGVIGSGGTTGSGAMGSGGGVKTGGATGRGGSSAMGGAGACQPATCGSHKWPCWRMPNAAKSGLPNAASYTDLGNGAVLDNLTCLTWEKSPDATAATGDENLARCAGLASSNFAGYGDWRIPTRVEMASIVDFTKPGYPSAFTSPSAYYRTISNWYETITGQNTSGFAWIYGSNGFTSNAYKWTDTAVVRCVRGNGDGEGQNNMAKEPPNHYNVDTAAGETTDNYTGLVWQQGSSPSTMAWVDAANYCATLGLGGHTWRVPSMNELSSIVNEALVGPAVNRTAFPSTHSGSKSNNWYWSNNAYSSSADWAINYDDGFTGQNIGADSSKWNYFTAAYVKCVR